MRTESAVDVTSLIKKQPSSNDYLTFDDIELEYGGIVKASSLRIWSCTHRHNFHLLITKIGKKSVVRRDRWESFLESRTGNQEPLAA